MPKKRYLSTHAVVRLLAVNLISLIFVERPLQAYADPGSGLLMWQLLGAVVIGAGYQVRRMIQKVRHFALNQKPSHRVEGSKRGLFLS